MSGGRCASRRQHTSLTPQRERVTPGSGRAEGRRGERPCEPSGRRRRPPARPFDRLRRLAQSEDRRTAVVVVPGPRPLSAVEPKVPPGCGRRRRAQAAWRGPSRCGRCTRRGGGSPAPRSRGRARDSLRIVLTQRRAATKKMLQRAAHACAPPRRWPTTRVAGRTRPPLGAGGARRGGRSRSPIAGGPTGGAAGDARSGNNVSSFTPLYTGRCSRGKSLPGRGRGCARCAAAFHRARCAKLRS